MHDGPFDHEHVTESDARAFASSIWAQEHVGFTTVGIDIGSSTTHLLFAKLVLQRESEGLSSRFQVTERSVLFESPIIHTPFLADGNIDAAELETFFAGQFEAAGLTRADVDTGAVILTGEAIKRHNARAIDDLFAAQGGKFVCAIAGHQMEAALAARGSGAAALSHAEKNCILHVDVGGGTTKLALIDQGEIVQVAAFAVGGRLVAQDDSGEWTRIDDAARLVAEDLGLDLNPGSLAATDVRFRLAARLAQVIISEIAGTTPDSLTQALRLTPPLSQTRAVDAISISGGVSEYLFDRENREFGDIAIMLADALKDGFAEYLSPARIVDPGRGIRATVTGASQFSVQVSGKTVFVSNLGGLGLHNMPVAPMQLTPPINAAAWRDAAMAARARLDLKKDAEFAFAFSWTGSPDYARLRACAEGIVAALQQRGDVPPRMALVIDGDVGRSLGLILHEEMGLATDLISIDGLQLHEFDYVDIGKIVDPPGVIPVIIKSLVI